MFSNNAISHSGTLTIPAATTQQSIDISNISSQASLCFTSMTAIKNTVYEPSQRDNRKTGCLRSSTVHAKTLRQGPYTQPAHFPQTSTMRSRTANEVIQEVFSMSKIQADNYLNKYHFDETSLLNSTAFATHIEQWEMIPDWAKHLSHPLVNAYPVDLFSGEDAPGHTREILLGSETGEEGAKGVIYEDREDASRIIKKLKDEVGKSRYSNSDISSSKSDFSDEFKILSINEKLKIACEEAKLFCQYYGEDAAEVFREGEDVYIRMLKVPGKPLSAVRENELPADAVKSYADMLGKLNDAGIMHGDLHSENVFFNVEDNTFYPIDISNIRDKYFSSNVDYKNKINQHDAGHWDAFFGKKV